MRDFVGYGNKIPKVLWPGNARIALSFVLNYEEGSESSILDGDDASESYLTDLPGALPLKAARHFSVESHFEYGSRAGVWRLLDLFEQENIPLTIFATGLALERNPPLAKALKNRNHEIAGHGYRWIDYRSVPKDLEKADIQRTIAAIQKLTDKKVVGWYTGRCSANTRELIVKAGLTYDSQSYADDLPYWVTVAGQKLLVIPYQLDTNDARYALPNGWSDEKQFLNYLKASFDYLYREGASSPKMMSVGMHPRLSGRPGRAEALYQFIQYIKEKKDVWVCKREEIAKVWNHE